MGGEEASPSGVVSQNDHLIIKALRGLRPIFATTVETFFEARADSGTQTSQLSAASRTRLELRDLTPVYIIPSAPYFGKPSLMFVFFSIGTRAYPPGLQLRITTKALDPLVGQSI